MVKTRKVGKSVYYSLIDDHILEIIKIGVEHVNES
jgi:DNA-binding transcriptional ArsR family regulator